jgi:hypothetical protein
MCLRLVTAALFVLIVAAGQDHQIAAGWTSPEAADYQAAIDRKTTHGGHPSIDLKSISAASKDYSARQSIRAEDYRGKRVRFYGWLKPDRADDGAALWLRVDMQNGDYILDGMLDLTSKSRPVMDASGWTKCELVAQIPDDAIGISFGVRMKGKGEIWASDFAFEVVDKRLQTTMIERRPYRGGAGKDAAIQKMRDQYVKAPMHPVNLSLNLP